MCSDTSLSSYFDKILNKSFKDAFAAMFDINRCPHHQCKSCHPVGTLLAYKEIIDKKSTRTKYTHENCKSHWCYNHQLAKTVLLPNDELCCSMEVCALYDISTGIGQLNCLIKTCGANFHCSNICTGCHANHCAGDNLFCDNCICSVPKCTCRKRAPGNLCNKHYSATLINSELCRVCGTDTLKNSYVDTSSRTFGCASCRCYNPRCSRLIRPGEIACSRCACECLLHELEIVGQLDINQLSINSRVSLLDSFSKVHYIPEFLAGTGFKSISMDRDKQCPSMYKSTQFYLCEKNARHIVLTFDPDSKYSSAGRYLAMIGYVKKNYDESEIDRALKVMLCPKCENPGCDEDICFYPTVKGKPKCLFHSRAPTLCYTRTCHNPVDPVLPGLNPIRLCDQCYERTGVFRLVDTFMIYPKAVVATMMRSREYAKEKIHEFVVGIMSGRRKIKAGKLQLLDESTIHPMKQNLVWFTNLVLYGDYKTALTMTNIQLAAMEIDPSLVFDPKGIDQASIAILFTSTLPLNLAMRVLSMLS